MNNKPKLIIKPGGTKEWLLNGKRHREDGPAVEWADGTKAWFLNDKQYTYKEWYQKTLHNVDPETRKAYKDILSEL